jgi:hypothetical protein
MATTTIGNANVQAPKRGAIPTPRSVLAAARPHVATLAAPPSLITIPAQLSMWGNDVHGDCVTAEEAFAKACNSPEIFIAEAEAISWATSHGVLDGAYLTQVMQWMQNDGFTQTGYTYDDGPYLSVDWATPATLQSAISNGPVKIGIAANQLETAWYSTNGQSGWFATGFKPDAGEDHCVSLCGYGSVAWLAQQLKVQVPSGIDGTKPGYALYTWKSIGIIDEPSMVAITHEAWLRQPTTKTVMDIHVPASVCDPDAYVLINDPTSVLEQHNLFRSADGHIQALWFNFAQGWHYEDRNEIVAGVPSAVDGPYGYAFVDGPKGVVELHNLFSHL